MLKVGISGKVENEGMGYGDFNCLTRIYTGIEGNKIDYNDKRS